MGHTAYGGIYAVTMVNSRPLVLTVDAIASMNPVNLCLVLMVVLTDGFLPTVMPPARYRGSWCRRFWRLWLDSAAVNPVVMNCGIGGRGFRVFVSTRAMMSTLVSFCVSIRSVRLCSSVCRPLQFQNRILMVSQARGRGHGTWDVRGCLLVRNALIDVHSVT